MNTQPNFEIVKRAFYQSFASCPESDFYIAISGSLAGDFRSFYKRAADFKEDFNKWLDRVDIRCCMQLVEAVVKYGKVTIPKWISQKQFAIEYNDNGCLDLIRTNEEIN